MKKYVLTFVLMIFMSILSSCSWPFTAKEADPQQLRDDFQMKEDEKLFERYADGYLTFTHELTLKRDAPSQARHLRTELSPSSSGYFEDLYVPAIDFQKDDSMIYSDTITYRLSGSYKLSDQTAFGQGEKRIQYHELEREDFTTEFPLSYRNKTYTNIETEEDLHIPLLFEPLRQIASLPEPTVLNTQSSAHLNLSDKRWFELFGDDLPINYDEWIDASIVVTADTRDPRRIALFTVKAQWYTEEFKEKVRYTLDNHIYFNLGGSKDYRGLPANELYEYLQKELAP